MPILLVIALVLSLPVAVDAEITFISVPSAAMDVEISVAGTVPLSSGPFLIDDTFFLHGTGSAGQVIAGPDVPSVVRRRTSVDFNVSGGGVTATGQVISVDTREGSPGDANLHLITPFYALDFFQQGSGLFAFIDPGNVISFSASSDNAHVQVGDETATLVGTAGFSGSGVPEPTTVILLTLGALGIAAVGHRLRSSACEGV